MWVVNNNKKQQHFAFLKQEWRKYTAKSEMFKVQRFASRPSSLAVTFAPIFLPSVHHRPTQQVSGSLLIRCLDQSNFSPPSLGPPPVRCAGNSLSPCTASRSCRSCPTSCWGNTAPLCREFTHQHAGNACFLSTHAHKSNEQRCAQIQKDNGKTAYCFLQLLPCLNCCHTTKSPSLPLLCDDFSL